MTKQNQDGAANRRVGYLIAWHIASNSGEMFFIDLRSGKQRIVPRCEVSSDRKMRVRSIDYTSASIKGMRTATMLCEASYASFTLQKVIGYHDGLQELRDSLPKPLKDDADSRGFALFLNELIEYLGQIKDRKMDCWFMTG